MSSAVRLLLAGVLVAPISMASAQAETTADTAASDTAEQASPVPLAQADALPPEPIAAAPAATQPSEEIKTIPVDTAEAPEEAEKKPGVRNRIIEEIIVTAQKREDAIQDVPISIQAFSDDSLSARNIASTDQLGPLIPSLRFTQAAGYTLVYMRGIGTSQFVPSADPSIASYVDGIYIPAGQAGTQSLGNIERVEVLKGPQGTLFGRNSIGGAINVVTKGPSRDEFNGSVEASYSDLDYGSSKALISGPVTDWFAFSLAGGYERNQPYIDATNYKIGDAVTKTARTQLGFYPADNLSLVVTGYYAKEDNVNLAIGQNSKPKPLGTATLNQPQGDDFVVDNDLPAVSKSNQKVAYGILTYNAPWLDVKVLASTLRFNIPQYDYDFDGTELPLVGFDTRKGNGLPGEYSDIQTGELQFISNDDSWLSDRLKWVAGLYYYQGVAAFDPARFRVAPGLIQGGLGVLSDTLGIPLQLPTGLTDLLDDAAAFSPLGTQGAALSLSGVLETKSYSAYTQATYTFTDWLDVTLGGRLQKERRFLTKSETNAYNPVTGDTLPLLKYPLLSNKETNFSPKAQISVRPRDNALIFASYGEGYKSGTYNIVAIYTAPEYIVPEHVTSYELGAKVDFLDGLLRVNGALFYNEIDNLQDGFVSLLSGGAVSFNTAKAARTKGAEIDLTWVPLPDVDPGLAITGNAAYVDAIYTDFKNGEGFTEPSGLYSGNLDLSGSRLRNTPKLSGSLGFVQAIDVDNGSIEIGSDVYYTSRFYYNANNTVSEDPYAILSARVSYLYQPWQLRMTLFGQNLTDERYHLAQFETDFGLLTTLAAPRQIGLRLNWAF